MTDKHYDYWLRRAESLADIVSKIRVRSPRLKNKIEELLVALQSPEQMSPEEIREALLWIEAMAADINFDYSEDK